MKIMNELFWKMQKHDIKLEVESMKDSSGYDCVIFIFIASRNPDGSKNGVGNVFYQDRVTASPGYVLQELNRVLDRFIERQIQHNLNQ